LRFHLDIDEIDLPMHVITVLVPAMPIGRVLCFNIGMAGTSRTSLAMTYSR